MFFEVFNRKVLQDRQKATIFDLKKIKDIIQRFQSLDLQFATSIILFYIIKMYIKSISILLLLLLITIAASDSSPSCPYCRKDKCVVVQKNLHSCTECASGVLIKVATFPYGDKKPGVFGVCQPCPDKCNKCLLDYIQPAFSSPYYIIRCTSCKQRTVWDQTNGICNKCPANCSKCRCVPKVYPRSTTSCYEIACDTCDKNYKLDKGKCVKHRLLLNDQETNAGAQDLIHQ